MGAKEKNGAHITTAQVAVATALKAVENPQMHKAGNEPLSVFIQVSSMIYFCCFYLVSLPFIYSLSVVSLLSPFCLPGSWLS